METLVQTRSYFKIGELIKNAIIQSQTVNLTPLTPYFAFIDQEILTTYFAFVEKSIPDQLRKIDQIPTQSIITAFDILQKVKNHDISALELLDTKFELTPAKALMAKAALLSQVHDRENLIPHYMKLTEFPLYLTGDFLSEFADLAWAVGVVNSEMMMGFPVEWLCEFKGMTRFLHSECVEVVDFEVKFAFGEWEILVDCDTARKWQGITAVMNYFMRQPVSERSKLEYASAVEELKLTEEQLELIVSEMVLKNLVKASIDSVGQIICVTWVKPLVLDAKGREIVVERLQEWNARIHQTKALIERIMIEEDDEVV